MSTLDLSLRFLQAQPDHRLVELARNGREPAFEALVRRYRAGLLAYCRRLQPTTGSAEDVLQQTLLQAWKALTSGTEVREFRPWLYRIAHNASLNSLRVVTAVPTQMLEEAGGQEVGQLVDQRMRIRAAFTELAALPTLQRQAFVSSMLDGASHDEVAASLGLSPGAVRGLIYRARSAMRAAAAAVTPGPVLGWAIRRAETQTGGATAVAQAMVGGGGTGLVAALAKGGAVITLAGAVAGAGGAILTPAHHHRRATPTQREVNVTQRVTGLAGYPGSVRTSLVGLRGDPGSGPGAGPAGPLTLLVASGSRSGNGGRRGASGGRRGRLPGGPGPIGSSDASIGRSDGGRGPSAGSGGPSGSAGGGGDGASGRDSSRGSDGGPSGSGSGSGHDSSRGSDGGPSGSGSSSGSDSGTGIPTVAITDGGTSGGDSTAPSAAGTTTTRGSNGGSGPDGSSSGTSGSGSSSGSGSASASGSSDFAANRVVVLGAR